MIKKFFSDERGSAVIIFALGLTVFLGFLALVTDVGLLYSADFQLTNALDSAVLAGAQELPVDSLSAIEKAVEYAQKNGVEANNLTIEVFNNNRALKATSQKEINLLFARVLGVNTGKVAHTAVAEVLAISALNGAAPLGIEKQQLIFGQKYTLKVGAGDTDLFLDATSGWFGALAMGDQGASTYEENLTYGYTGTIKVGDILNMETGNISNPTKRSIDYRIASDTTFSTIDNFKRESPRLLKVPVIEVLDKKKVKVVSFAMFLVDEVAGQGNDNFVTGTFVKTIDTGEVDSSVEDYGLVGVRLTE